MFFVKSEMKVILVVVLLNLVHPGKSAVKIWKYDNDILNPVHWVGGKPGEHCDGFDLRDARYNVFAIDVFTASKILLAEDIKLYLLEGAHIDFVEDDPEQLNCVRVKNDFEAREWDNPNSWITEGAEHNVAVPHVERTPCYHDDVVFPKGWKSSQCVINSRERRIRTFRFGSEYVTNRDLRMFTRASVSIFWFDERFLNIDGTACDDPTGCLCLNSINGATCDGIEEPQEYRCREPIMPIGFCLEICGAAILINNTSSFFYKKYFKIESIRNALAGYSSDTHVSKVSHRSETLIQIIFAEKEFSGVSLDEAKEFHSRLLEDLTFGAPDAILISSGPLFIEGKAARTAVSIVFGCLCGVLLVFALIFLLNSPNFTRLNLTNRYHFTSRPLSTFLAKFENTENEGLIFERASMGGSVISLDKSFDNPMFGTSATSIASTSYDTVVVPGEKTSKSEISLENPMYDINSLNGCTPDVDGTEDNQLVDLAHSED